MLLFGERAAQLEPHPVVRTGKHNIALEADVVKALQPVEQFFPARQAGSQQEQVEHIDFVFQIMAVVNRCSGAAKHRALQGCQALRQIFGASTNKARQQVGDASRQASIMIAGFERIVDLFRGFDIAR